MSSQRNIIDQKLAAIEDANDDINRICSESFAAIKRVENELARMGCPSSCITMDEFPKGVSYNLHYDKSTKRIAIFRGDEESIFIDNITREMKIQVAKSLPVLLDKILEEILKRK